MTLAIPVLITGVSSGIGEATARHFIDGGTPVFGIDQTSPPETLDLAGFALADLGAIETLPSVVGRLLSGVEALGALINNAAIQRCMPLTEASAEDFRAVLDVNLVAPFILAQQCLPYLKRCRGAVVNVASVHAIATSGSISLYAASKGGLVALTRAMSLELAPFEIRVNAVLPGAVDTPMLADGLARDATEADPSVVRKAFDLRHPLKRIGQPEELARAIAFLSDGEVSGFITGTTLVVDGGVTARLSTEVDL